MPDVFLHLPEHLTTLPSSDRHQSFVPSHKLTLFYFITGNPGLIDYYIPFLTVIANEGGKNTIVAGASLAGFEARTSSSRADPTEVADDGLLSLFPEGFTRKDVYNLRDQIDVSYLRIQTLVARLHRLVAGSDTDIDTDEDKSTPVPIDVMLAGHSVGAYIALEVVRRRHEEFLTRSRESENSSSEFSRVKVSGQRVPWSISATFLLTPTIQDISLSRSGRIATPVLSSLPGFPYLVQIGASGLTATLPTTWLSGLVGRVTGMRNGQMVDATTEFLRRPGAVRQALHLASCEMAEIGEGRWTDAVWGATEEVSGGAGGSRKGEGGDWEWRVPINHFLFAKEDHWVADETREAIVRSLNGAAKTKVDGDEMGLVHAWCLDQSELVAGIVSEWMEKILQADTSTSKC